MGRDDQGVAPILAHPETDRRGQKKFSEAHLRARLVHLIRETKLYPTLKDFLVEVHNFLGDCQSHPLSAALFDDSAIKMSEKTLSDYMGGDSGKLNAHTYRLIVYFLHYKKQWEADIFSHEIAQRFPDPLFHAMIHFLDVSQEHLLLLTKRAPGLYWTWMPSITYSGSFARGLLEVSVGENSAVLHTREIFQSRGQQGRIPKTLTYDGYLFRRSRKHFIVRRNNASHTLSTTILPDYEVENSKIAIMFGSTLDMSGNRPFSARVFYERADGGRALSDEERTALEGKIDIVAREDMPESLLAFFDEKEHPHVKFF